MKKTTAKTEQKKRTRSVTDEERQFLAQAERMYIREKKRMEDISAVTNVPVRTLYRWRKKYNWDDRLFDWETSATGIAEKTMKLLHEFIQGVGKLDTTITDTLVKTASAIRKLDSDFDMLGTTLMVVEELTFYLRTNDPEGFNKIQETLPGFLLYMRDKYKK